MRSAFRSFLLELRNRHYLVIDLVILVFLPWLAMLVRVETIQNVLFYSRSLAIYTFLMLAWKPLVLYLSGVYERYWPFASTDSLIVLLGGTGSTMVAEIIIAESFLLGARWMWPTLPRSLPYINGGMTMAALIVVRFGVRIMSEFACESGGDRTPVLIVGAGTAGSMVARELRLNAELKSELVGYLDDNPQKEGLFIHGIPVLGPLSRLGSIVRAHHVKEVIVAIPSAAGSVVRMIDAECKAAGVKSKTIPTIFELLDGSARVSQIRDIQIEDLLRRGVVQTDTLNVSRLLSRSSVMVTGAGGSIGGELCRQIIVCNPAELILLGHGENSIFQIANELRKHPSVLDGETRLQVVVADMRDEDRMERVFRRFTPRVVFHAAAHKHVGLMEGNLQDAVSNNVLGTRTLVELSDLCGVERFVMISTDKAVNPSSVMGATKRIAELIVQETALRTRKAFVSVRFGNVLGSRGSVVPIFKAQIAAGGPVKVTHPQATRFFMTIPEAVQLVLQSATLGNGGEVFVLDMGEQIRILDLARDVIRLSGFKEGEGIDIEYTGLAWGEKLHEELFYEWEVPERSMHEKIFVCRTPMQQSLHELLAGTGVSADTSDLLPAEGHTRLRREVDRLIVMSVAGHKEEAMCCIRRIVPQYRSGGDAAVLHQDLHDVAPRV
jgi:FlaA1/EpsC-like NDP-sugar epimerase